MHIEIVPQLRDNYAYLVWADGSTQAAVIDPSEPEKVVAAVQKLGLELTTIMNTHHHWDHTGGNEGLLADNPKLDVIGYAPDAERIPGITRPVNDGETIDVVGMPAVVLAVPCHTSGHVAYKFGRRLFTGDTLFAGGCGRFFEGTAAQMHRALVEIIGGLPDETEIYCGHEYTASNLRFAKHVDGDNTAIDEKAAEVEATRKDGRPTIPTTLAEERTYNPFLRAHTEGIRKTIGAADASVDLSDPVAVLGALRAMKDAF